MSHALLGGKSFPRAAVPADRPPRFFSAHFLRSQLKAGAATAATTAGQTPSLLPLCCASASSSSSRCRDLNKENSSQVRPAPP